MQKVNFWGYVVSDILGVFLIVFAMQKSLPMMLLFMFLKGTFAGTMSGTLNALIAEISGYTYRTKGVHIDGMMFSCSSLGVKVGGGIGTAAVGWLLDAAGYVGTAEAQSGFYPGGVYSYEKSFFAPEEWKEQDVVLEFEGIYGTAKVWINGALAAVNRNGYMGFLIDLKPWIRYGEKNQLKVDADNSNQPDSRWYSGAGIYRDVNLWTGKGVYVPHDKLRVTTLFVRDEMAVLEVCAELKNRTGQGRKPSVWLKLFWMEKR